MFDSIRCHQMSPNVIRRYQIRRSAAQIGITSKMQDTSRRTIQDKRTVFPVEWTGDLVHGEGKFLE